MAGTIAITGITGDGGLITTVQQVLLIQSLDPGLLQLLELQQTATTMEVV